MTKVQRQHSILNSSQKKSPRSARQLTLL